MNKDNYIFSKYPELRNITEDNVSGSRKLLLKINNWFLKNITGLNDPLPLISELKQYFAEFQAIQKYLSEIEPLIKTNQVITFLNNFEKEQEESFNQTIEKAVHELKNFSSFLTLSNSETLRKLFIKVHKINQHLNVIVSESRPMNEGQLLAEYLLENNIRTELITEAMLSSKINVTDCAVIGCDKVLSNGNVVNKIGSNILALLAKENSKPFYVIADKYKFAENNYFSPALRPSSEIWEKNHPRLIINNIYFEEIDSSFITKIIS